MKRSLQDLHGYQNRAIKFSLENPHCALWLDMGLGKTAVALHAIWYLLDSLQTRGVLIVAPLRVCQTVWEAEARKWQYTTGLIFERVLGGEDRRRQALRRPAHVYLINYENLSWLWDELQNTYLARGKVMPFDMLIWDEVSRMKGTRTVQGVQRGQAARAIVPYMRRIVGLTGTPASNGYVDLYGQFLVTDQGARLGTSFERYRNEYFYRVDWNGYAWAPFAHSVNVIRDKIGDITISMSNEDYLDLPPIVINDIWVDLPPKARKLYEDMEKNFFLELDSGAAIEIDNQASLLNRGLQVANGAVYTVPGEPKWEKIHDAKLQALEEVIEESAGEPILLTYQFQHDAFRTQKRYPKVEWINSKVSHSRMLEIQETWDKGQLPLLMGHPASIGHGLNLQAGSNILVMLGTGWSQDLYSQVIARLRRQGQTRAVTVHRILARDTFDEAQVAALAEKETNELAIRKAIADYKHNKKNPG